MGSATEPIDLFVAALSEFLAATSAFVTAPSSFVTAPSAFDAALSAFDAALSAFDAALSAFDAASSSFFATPSALSTVYPAFVTEVSLSLSEAESAESGYKLTCKYRKPSDTAVMHAPANEPNLVVIVSYYLK